MRSRRVLVLLTPAPVAAAVVGYIGGLVLALAVGALVLGLTLIVARSLDRPGASLVPERRRFLRAMGLTGLGLVVGGAAVARTARG